MPGVFRFSFGPWNISEGADPFGPPVRDTIPFNRKLEEYRRLGFEGVQFHDDDAVPDLDDLGPEQVARAARSLRSRLEDHGLVAEFVAPRLWEDPRTIDGGFTSNDATCRRYALERSKRSVDIARELNTDLIVLWLAREGTYLREAKNSIQSVERILEAVDGLLAYDDTIRIAIEPKPNEPMDIAYIPTTGHALGLASRSISPERVGVLIESAHAILAGLDPSDEMGFALAFGSLFGVHLNDQNGMKYDQDRSFGSVDLRRAFNQVRLLDHAGYGSKGEWIGLDVKALRTQEADRATAHLSNSKSIFLRLLEVSRALDEKAIAAMKDDRDYEALDLLLTEHLLGAR